MLTAQQATQLLKQYEKALNAFQIAIQGSSQKHLLRCDTQIVPNILLALHAIADGNAYKPDVTTSGMSSITLLSSDPNAALKELLVDNPLGKHFRDMCNHYTAPESELRKDLKQFHNLILNPNPMVIYKSKTGRLAIKFFSQEWRDKFIKELGGFCKFASDDRYNANRDYLTIYNNNPTTVYITAYIAKDKKGKEKELTAIFPTQEMREKFLILLRHAPAETFSIYNGQEGVYFNDRNLHIEGYNISINTPVEISASTHLAKADVRYASRMLAQASRDRKGNSSFKFFPDEILKLIASLSTDHTICPQQNVLR